MGHDPQISHENEAQGQRFRASIISSLAMHVGILLAVLIGPMMLPRTITMPPVTPVLLVSLPAAAPPVETPEPEAAEPEPEIAEPEPEPIEPVATDPEPIPRSIEDLRREREEEEAERRRREEEEAERRRREEEARRPKRQTASRTRRDPQPAQPQTAQRRAIDILGTGQGPDSVTVEDFPFAYYLQILQQKVGENWHPPPRADLSAQRSVNVYFRIDRNGRLLMPPRLMNPSGDTLFDSASQRAIVNATFPPLPQTFQGTSLGVRFAFIQE